MLKLGTKKNPMDTVKGTVKSALTRRYNKTHRATQRVSGGGADSDDSDASDDDAPVKGSLAADKMIVAGKGKNGKAPKKKGKK